MIRYVKLSQVFLEMTTRILLAINWVDSKDGDYKYRGGVNDNGSGSNSPTREAAQKAIGGGNLKDRAAAAMLFQYSDDDYNHLYDDNLNEDEKRIDNADSNKRVKR